MSFVFEVNENEFSMDSMLRKNDYQHLELTAWEKARFLCFTKGANKLFMQFIVSLRSVRVALMNQSQQACWRNNPSEESR